MMEKFAQAGGGGGGAGPPLSLYLASRTKLLCTPAERADTLTLFHLYPYVRCIGTGGNLHVTVGVQEHSVHAIV
jgi:hypothetical protein